MTVTKAYSVLPKKCPYVNAVSSFVKGACAPGVYDGNHKYFNSTVPENICSLCTKVTNNTAGSEYTVIAVKSKPRVCDDKLMGSRFLCVSDTYQIFIFPLHNFFCFLFCHILFQRQFKNCRKCLKIKNLWDFFSMSDSFSF